MNGDITFNTHDLQTYDPITRVGIITNVIEHSDIPNQVGELLALADANGSVIPDINYPSRSITIGGAIKGSSQADLDNRLDTFKGYFNGKNKDLDIAYGGSTRRYIATKNAVAISRQQKALFATFTVEFICTDPFGRDITATTLINQTGYTDASLSQSVTFGGTAPFQQPLITITINTLTGSGDSIQISNGSNGQEMVLYGLGLADGDELIIDNENHEVTVNGESVDYNGVFLEFEPGAHEITITDNFTTRDVDILVDYFKRYL